MSKNLKLWLSIPMLAISLIGVLAALFLVPSSPQAVGADAAAGTTLISWDMFSKLVLLICGPAVAGSLSMIRSIILTATSVVKQVPAVVNQQADPATGQTKVVTDSIELVQAVIAYAPNRDDKAAKRRFVTAAMTELADLAEFKSPEVAKAFSDLGHKITDAWFPEPAKVNGGAT